MESCIGYLEERGIKKNNIKTIRVPGAFELPFACQQLAESKNFNAIISLGAIIRGETKHFDFIAFAVSQGIMKIGLKEKTPIVFGILTTENADQAKDRIKGGKKGDKGIEAAYTALKMIKINSYK